MANYYALVSGLPDISVEQRKMPFSQKDFGEELKDVLTSYDYNSFRLLELEQFNRHLLKILPDKEKNIDLDAIQTTTQESVPHSDEDSEQDVYFDSNQINTIISFYMQGMKPPLYKNLPSYVYTFLDYEYSEKEDGEREHDPLKVLSPEDRLSMLYYEYAIKQSNDFVSDWFKLNLNIKNILAVYTCRKLGWDPNQFIIGDSHIEKQLRTSSSKDFGLSEELDYLPSIIQIAEEMDITRRERMLDLFRWNWIEEKYFRNVFGIEHVLGYYLQLGIIERWVNLNEVKGEETFRKIVYSLKQESRKSLDEFKRKQQK